MAPADMTGFHLDFARMNPSYCVGGDQKVKQLPAIHERLIV